ncbi:MAG: ferric reductase [Rhizobiaceae bacterium]|nr:ferric reductase [Rhizobiaceae bacterium]
MNLIRTTLTWCALAVIIAVPVIAAATSPLLAWRDPIYIAAGFAGIIAMVLLFLQPLLIGGLLPGLPAPLNRNIHRWVGSGLILAVVIHVAGLWVTSPPDVVDALLFMSPTPFSSWGVIAMWTAFGAALVIIFRRRMPAQFWRLGHTVLVAITVVGSVVHALLIEGTMEAYSKSALCGLVLVVTIMAVTKLRVWTVLVRRRN